MSRVAEDLCKLLRECTVRILTSENLQGTGFFVAPSLILTCAHVLKQEGTSPQPTVTVLWNQQAYSANIEQMRDRAYPDIALLRIVDAPDHPYVRLGEEMKLSDELYCYGYSIEHPNGDSVTLEYEGPRDKQDQGLKLKSGQVFPGLSGAPLLNMRTGRVCGVVKSTRGRETSLGGGAIPISTVLQEFEQVKIAQHETRWDKSRWGKLLEELLNPTRLPHEKISYFSLLTTFLEGEGQWFQRDFKQGRIYVPEKEYFDTLKQLLFTKHRALLFGRSAAGKTVLAVSFARYLQEHVGYNVCYKDAKQAEMGDGRKWYTLMREHDRPNLLYILDNCHLASAEVSEFCRQWRNQAPTDTQCFLVSRTNQQEADAEEDSYFQMFADDEKIQIRSEKIWWKIIEQYVTSLPSQDFDYVNALKSDSRDKLAGQHEHNLVISRSRLDAWQTLATRQRLSEVREQDAHQALEKKYLSVYGTALATLCILQRYEIRVHKSFVRQLAPDEIKQLEKEKLLIHSSVTGYGQLYDLVLHPSEARELFLAYVYDQQGYVTREEIDSFVISTLESYLKTGPSNYVAVYESLARHKQRDMLKSLLSNRELQEYTASKFNKETVLDAIRYVYRVVKFDRAQAARLTERVIRIADIEGICAKLLKSTFQDIALLLRYTSVIDSEVAQRIASALNIEQLAQEARKEYIHSLFRLARALQEAAPPEIPLRGQALLLAIPVEVLVAKTTMRNFRDIIKQLRKYKYPLDRLIEALDISRFAQQSERMSLQSLFWALHTLEIYSPAQAQTILMHIPLKDLSEKANKSNLESIDQIIRLMRKFNYSTEQIIEFVEPLNIRQVVQYAGKDEGRGNLQRLTDLLRTLKSISAASVARLLGTLTSADMAELFQHSSLMAELFQHSSLEAIPGFLQYWHANRHVREGYALFQESYLEQRLRTESLDTINEFLNRLYRIRHVGHRLARRALDFFVAADISEHLATSNLHSIQLLILNVAKMDSDYLQPIWQALPCVNIIEKFEEASLRTIGLFLWNVYSSIDRQMAQEYSMYVDQHVQMQRLEKALPEDVCFLLWNITSISTVSPLRLLDEPIIHHLLQSWNGEAGWSEVLAGIAAMAQSPIQYSNHFSMMHMREEALRNWFTTSKEGHNLYFLALAVQGMRIYNEETTYTLVRNILSPKVRTQLQSARSSAITPRSIALIDGIQQWLAEVFEEMK